MDLYIGNQFGPIVQMIKVSNMEIKVYFVLRRLNFNFIGINLYFVTVKFSREEMELFKTLGNRDYLLDEWEKKTALFSLVDILFAFAYNHRTTLGEYSVESAWTINKLSATMSWFQVLQLILFF